MVCERVFATSVEAAGDIADVARDEVLSALALTRGAAGHPAVTIIEQRVGDSWAEPKYRFDQDAYRGNLAGGPIAGETQYELLMHHAAIQGDPLLHLCTDLYEEALAERSPDSQYFRFWSVLETLAINQVVAGQRVQLLDGTMWPDGGTTGQAGPRVYQLMRNIMFPDPARQAHESTLAAPASDLYDAVTGWYARRNATAHYGKFVRGDGKQTARTWYPDAEKTVPTGPTDEWLSALKRAVAVVLRYELNRVGGPLVS